MSRGFVLVELLIVIMLLGALFAMLMMGCSAYRDSQIKEGVVVDKQFIPYHMVTETRWQYTDDYSSIPIVDTYSVPESYRIYLKGTYKGKERTRLVVIDKTSYMILEIGDKLKLSDLPLKPMAERAL